MNNNFNVYCPSHEVTEKFFKKETLAYLNTCGFNPVLPASLKAARTVIVHRASEWILENDESCIKSEINNKNDWCTSTEIYKFKSLLKIIFETSTMADKCLELGLSLFNLHIPGREIRKDSFITLNTCYACYAIDDHSASNCPKRQLNKSYLICSNCSKLGHNYQNCSTTPDKFVCINCGGNHHSMASSCPRRKDIIREKRRKASTSSTQTYATVSKHAPRPDLQQIDLTPVYKSVSLVFLASILNHETPEAFSSTLNNLYKQNDLPTLNLDGFEAPIMTALKSFASHTLTTASTPTPSAPTTKIVPNYESTSQHKPQRPSNSAPELTTASRKEPPQLNGLFTTSPQHKPQSASHSAQANQTSVSSYMPPLINQPPTSRAKAWEGILVLKHNRTKISTDDDFLQAWTTGNITLQRQDFTSSTDFTRQDVKALLSKGGMPMFTPAPKEMKKKPNSLK